MKKCIALFVIIAFVASCGGSSESDKPSTPAETKPNDVSSYDPHRGEGKFTKVEIAPTLDIAKAESGSKISSVKCNSCHKTTDEKLVGPGWAGVTTRHTPEWILNFITNTDAMIDKDPKVQAQLEICLVRMPNQSLSDDDARNLYEYMRKIDGVK
jgi:mono/diheme cytochrome c family protein